MSPIDSWDGATAVFTGAGSTALQVLFVLIAFAMLVGFLAKMVLHERHAYAQMIAHEPVEAGPAVEGEPSVY
ncbi:MULTISPECIES: hypothetical protein [Nocardioides]|uniref:Uncharacterized protein n=1 Tax=Nocardioides vastitatis TaxID=2568655 RepID=A0ABW0ZI29_9ACTN|nr:hypothetical protein [Nocardioides sp.]THJ02048.1 hypothetical protein E7Z54_10760 [Nocardioides sp.]